MTARGRRLIADGLVRSTRKRGHAMSTLTHTRRDLALLTAIDAGRCQVVDPTVPDLRVDDRWFCDQPRARVLMAAGLLAGPTGRSHGVVAARLTKAGRAALRADPP